MAYELTTAFMGLVRQSRRPLNGLLNIFTSRPENVTEATVIEFDRIGKIGYTAKAKSRPGRATTNGRDVFANVSFTPPVYKEKVPFTVETLIKRQPGFTKYDVATKEAMIMSYTAEQVAMMLDKITNAELLQVAKILHAGTIPFHTDGMDEGNVPDVAFGVPGSSFATLANSGTHLYWDNSAAIPLDNMDEFIRIIVANAGGKTRIRDIYFGYLAFNAFLNRTDTKERLENLRMNLGGIDAVEADDVTGLAFLGTYMLGGKMVRFWMFDETYIDPNDNTTVKNYLDTKSVYFVGEGDYQVYHAGIDVIQGIQDPQLQSFIPADGMIRDIGSRIASSLYIRTYKDEQDSAVYLEVTKCPLYIPRTVNTFGRLTVLA